MTYKKELETRRVTVKQKIIDQGLVLDGISVMSPDWERERTKQNSLRVDLKTIESRINNLERKNIPIEYKTPKPQ